MVLGPDRLTTHAFDRSIFDISTVHFCKPIKVVQSFANACISTHLSHIIDSIKNSFLISWIFEVEYLRLSQISPRLTRKLHKSDLSSTFIDSNMDLYTKNWPKYTTVRLIENLSWADFKPFNNGSDPFFDFFVIFSVNWWWPINNESNILVWSCTCLRTDWFTERFVQLFRDTSIQIFISRTFVFWLFELYI